MMQYKLESINSASIYSSTRIVIIEDVLQQLTRITKTIKSVFHKDSSSESTKLSNPSQHLQYEIFRFDGEVNMSNSITLKKQLFNIISNKKSILLDMTKLNFIDSSGIATLIEGLHKAQSSGLKFVIVGASNLPLKMLELSQLDKVFTLFNSIQEVKF
ncbi:MAG: STAS domain-containing protein [Colwellia sp.]|nr:STAS domain-containing protein [Colwellia sp.]